MLWFFKGFLLNEDLFGVWDFMDVIPVYFTFQAGFPGGGLIKAASGKELIVVYFFLLQDTSIEPARARAKRAEYGSKAPPPPLDLGMLTLCRELFVRLAVAGRFAELLGICLRPAC
jgi:hypothetical protein